jgi:hypothetical protein
MHDKKSVVHERHEENGAHEIRRPSAMQEQEQLPRSGSFSGVSIAAD